MKISRGEIYEEFSGELPSALVNYSFWSGMAFVPVLLGLAIGYIVGFDTSAGQIFVRGGVAIMALSGLYVSFLLMKARSHALDAVDRGETHG